MPGVGRAVERAIGDRAHEKLASDLGPTARFRELAGHGRDIAAGAPARNQHRPRPAAELDRMVGDPARRRIAVFGRCWETMLWRMAIADADKDHVAAPAHVAAERIVGLLVAQHPAAAMEIDHDWMRPRRRRPVETIRQQTVGALQPALAGLADRPA